MKLYEIANSHFSAISMLNEDLDLLRNHLKFTGRNEGHDAEMYERLERLEMETHYVLLPLLNLGKQNYRLLPAE